jgi:hypothetical protein
MPVLSSNDTAPGRIWKAITPSDSTVLGLDLRAVYVGGDGNIALEDYDGNVVTFAGVLAGSLLPVRPRRVMATNTTATAIVGIY